MKKPISRIPVDKQQINELDKNYQDGYERIAETTEMAESQVNMLKDVWPDEKWERRHNCYCTEVSKLPCVF
jgi:hypothetical protein